MKGKINTAVFIVSIAAFSLIGSLFPQECHAVGVAMETYIKLTSTGATPAAGHVNFTAYHKEGAETDADNIIETEDTLNGTPDFGYFSGLGICKADITQVQPPEAVVVGNPYRLWVTDTTTSESATVTGTVTGINPTRTNPGGSSATALFLTAANYLAIPTGFSAVPGNGYVDLSWNVVPGATGYRIYRRPVSGNSNIVYERVRIITSGSATTWRDTGVVNGTTYYYIMSATNDIPRRSGHTDEASATPPGSIPTITPAPTITPTAPAPTQVPTATPIPPLGVAPGPLTASEPFTLGIALTEDITRPFDCYLFAETPAGIYTIFLDGSIKKGITPLYRNVPRFSAPFFTTVRPSVKIPASMKGKTITFYAFVIQAGKKPPVKKLSDLTSTTQHVIMSDKKSEIVS